MGMHREAIRTWQRVGRSAVQPLDLAVQPLYVLCISQRAMSTKGVCVMRPLSAALIKRLRIKEALEAELGDGGNLLPPQPGLKAIEPHATEVETWLSGQLQAGLIVAPQQVANARKSGHGIRPVPIVGIIERAVYRALTDFILRNEPDLDRSPKAYISFVQAPILYAGDLSQEGGPGFLKVFGSGIRYVVKTDISAFYQYVDHAVLASELVAKTGDYEAITALVEFLGELQGRQHGLPQLLNSSDRLSEVYIDIAERDLLRKGLAVWRFNDDFRIACRDYPGALRAIEALDEAARQIGLVISEYKTFTPTFTRYAFDTLGLQVDDTIPQGEQQDAEGAVADYTEIDETEEAEHSLELIRSAQAPSDDESGADAGPRRSLDSS
jgi:Reverse transcriptase (RNA-dependent DNA polymerase)